MKRREPVAGRQDAPDVTRRVPDPVKYELVAAAAGRCEFLGCPQYLFAHRVTMRGGYFGNVAHIRAFSPRGPRAGIRAQRIDIDLNAVENLMLLCRDCHALVDREVKEFTVGKLQSWKREHEERVAYLLGLPRENEAAVIEVWTSLSRPAVVRSHAKLVAALLPLYPSRLRNCLIHFADQELSDLALIPAATERIDKEVHALFASGGERPTHIAVFGITSIPLLVHLGARLGDRQDVMLFQYHRDTKDWKWKVEPARAEYEVRLLRQGEDPKCVALVLSLSGTVDEAALPSELDPSYWLYELRLTSETPHTGFLRAKGDLDRFRERYLKFQAELQAKHGSLQELVIVPAVPIPIAVSLGMDRLPKVAPALVVYDFDKKRPGRKFQRVHRVA